MSSITIPVLLIYVFFRDFRPNEPFLTQFILEDKNLTKVELYNEVYPVWSYSQAPFLILVLLVTDILKYRPVIWAGALGYVATMLLLIFGFSVKDMALMQVTYAVGTACEIGYKNYIFIILPKSEYSRVAFYLSAAALLGKSLSNFLAQILVDYGKVSYLVLNYISGVSTSVALITSFCIPSVTQVVEESPQIQTEDNEKTKIESLKQYWIQMKMSYSSASTRTWSYWSISVTAAYFMISNTTQSLWEDLATPTEQLYNGYVYALNFLVSASMSYVMALRDKNVKKVTWWIISVLTLAVGVLTFIPTLFASLYIAYLCDTIFNIAVSATICICSFKIAEGLETNLFGFVAGVNTCVAAIVDLLVSFIVIDKECLGLSPLMQYRVYGAWLLATSLAFVGYTIRVSHNGRSLGERLSHLV